MVNGYLIFHNTNQYMYFKNFHFIYLLFIIYLVVDAIHMI
jgi:hypothetical protein